MFWSSIILSELVQRLAKVTLLLNHSVKLLRCMLCGDVAGCLEMACVLFVVRRCADCVVQTSVCTTNSTRQTIYNDVILLNVLTEV